MKPSKVTLDMCRHITKIAYDAKKQFCRKLYKEGQWAWNELKPYEANMNLLNRITECEFHDILNRPDGNKPVAEYIALDAEQMRALNNLKAALDQCEQLGISGYTKQQ